MTGSRRLVIAGNWKMNGTLSSLTEILKINLTNTSNNCDIIICPPATLLMEACNFVKDKAIEIGAQNCHSDQMGPNTGEVSAKMLADIGVRNVILGHSERRIDNFETNSFIEKKIRSAHEEGLQVILCVGESDEEKNLNQTDSVVRHQISECLPRSSNEKNTIIAYEPIWAIGTGKTPSLSDINSAHKNIRTCVAQIMNKEISSKIRILYGGSVKPENSKDILALSDVDGALIGGASLLANDLNRILDSI